MRPVVEASAAVAVGGRKPVLVGGPEPAVDVLGEELGSIAAVEVAQATRSPDVWHALATDTYIVVTDSHVDNISY